MAPQALRVMALLAAGGFLLPPGFSQGRGGTGPPAGTTSTGGSTGSSSIGTGARTPGTVPTTPTNPSTNPTPGTITQPIYISGRVLLEDGTPPPEPVTIERVCSSGSPHAEGYTDGQGYFGIQLGQTLGVMQDASEIGNGSPNVLGDPNRNGVAPRSSLGTGGTAGGTNPDFRYTNCDLQAKLAGYRSQLVSLTNHRAMDNPDIGTILLHRMSATEGTTVSAASLAAPKDARKAFDKGEEAARKKKWDEAEKSFQKAVDLYPGYAAAWYELGRLQANAAPDTARISFECAMKADPKYAAPYADLAMIEVQAKKWKEVVSLTDRGIRLDAFDYPELFFYNAVANYYLKNSAVAEKNVRQAVKLDSRHHYPQTAYLLGLLLIQRQDYAGAAEQIQTYLKLAPDADDAPAAKQKLEQLAKISAQGDSAHKQDQ
ncbi:MAG TPA: tetratricopeptide repeat protein [Bryobacteraceae bacterium]|nr:tetratricopeptide repeat protein [Bryobacteraceae bacterium]